VEPAIQEIKRKLEAGGDEFHGAVQVAAAKIFVK